MKLSEYIKIMGFDTRVVDEQSIESMRIVETSDDVTLESLDEDCDIINTPLKLKEACFFNFEKHTVDEDRVDDDKHKTRRYANSNENAREYDRRYKENVSNRIKFK